MMTPVPPVTLMASAPMSVKKLDWTVRLFDDVMAMPLASKPVTVLSWSVMPLPEPVMALWLSFSAPPATRPLSRKPATVTLEAVMVIRVPPATVPTSSGADGSAPAAELPGLPCKVRLLLMVRLPWYCWLPAT